MKLTVCVYESCIIQENNRLFRKPPLLGPPLSLPDAADDVKRQPSRSKRESDACDPLYTYTHIYV